MDYLCRIPFVDFGNVLRYYRNKNGLSQEQLANGICTREYIGLIEKNKKIPTLYMIDAFSKKLEINLFDAYALIIEHNDFDTHNKIEMLNEAIKIHDENRLFKLATEFSALPGFSSGVPLQYIKHAFSLYYSNVIKDYKKSITYATEGLAVSGLPDADMTPIAMLSIIDLCLLLVKSVNLCRNEQLYEGRKYLEYLHGCTKLRIMQNRYIANRNRRFDINMFALTTFNICEFFPDNIENNITLLDESTKLLDDYKCSNMQPELLLYKSRYLYDLGDTDKALYHFKAGYFLLVCQRLQEDAEKAAKEILEERFDKLNG